MKTVVFFTNVIFLLEFMPNHSMYEIKPKGHTHLHTQTYTHKDIGTYQFDSSGDKFGDQTTFTRLIIYFEFVIWCQLIE